MSSHLVIAKILFSLLFNSSAYRLGKAGLIITAKDKFEIFFLKIPKVAHDPLFLVDIICWWSIPFTGATIILQENMERAFSK